MVIRINEMIIKTGTNPPEPEFAETDPDRQEKNEGLKQAILSECREMVRAMLRERKDR